MEVPVINRVGDLQLPIGRLPMLISQLPEILSFWKWGAVILAVYAIVNSVLVRFKFELIRFSKRQSDLTKALLSYSSDDDYSSDNDVTVSSEDEDVYDEDDEGEEEVEEFDFRVAGTRSFEKDGDNMRRFSWSNFANGKSVVKLWDGIGLGLDLSSSSGSIVAIHDLNHHHPVSQSPTPPVILSAGKDKDRNVKLSLIDTRLGRESMIANWTSSELFIPTVAAISSDGVQRVYFGDEAGEKVKAVDLRMATEWDGDVVVGFW